MEEQRYITSNWFNEFPLGQEDPGTRHWIDDTERKLGGDEKLVTYNFNDWRYRGTIEPGQHVDASFGCSHAMGYGVDKPYAEIIEFANCGVSGLSNDAIARLAHAYCKQFSPKNIVVLWTIPTRREWVDDTGQLQKFKMERNPTHWQQNFIDLQNDQWDEYNLIKNKLFLEYFCHSRGIQLFSYDFVDNDKAARDGIHPGPDWHLNMAANILSNPFL